MFFYFFYKQQRVNIQMQNIMIEKVHPRQFNAFNALKRNNFDILINGSTYQDSPILLFTDNIILRLKNYQNFVYLKVTFTFTLIFTTTLSPNNQDILSIKLEQEGQQIIIKSKNPTELIPWKIHFSKNIMQRGFHETYKAIKKIGKGSFATVYLVQKKDDLKKYAVKAFSKEHLNCEPKGRESVMNEINVIRKLNHSNLMKLHAMYQTEHSIYLVLQLLQGGSLADRIGKQNKIASLEIKIILKTLLEGIKEMHAHKIMHRDIKPQNILFRKEKDVNCIIGDFGFSQQEQNEQFLFTRCGTPGFVAPQIFNLKDKKGKYGCACDIFSAGVIFHMLLFNEPLFLGNKQEALKLNKACSLNFEDDKYQSLPPLQLDLLQKMLEKDPFKRITARQALKHQYFQNQLLLTHQIPKLNPLKIQPKFLRENFSFKEYESKSNLPCNISQQKNKIVRDNSCLKLNTKENALRRNPMQLNNLNNSNSSNSVQLKISRAKINAIGGLSRFKRIAVQI